MRLFHGDASAQRSLSGHWQGRRWTASSSTATAVAPPKQRLFARDLDSWAESVLGHVHSRPSSEPYSLSPTRDFGGNVETPEDWSISLRSAAGLKGSASPNQDAFSYTLLRCGWIVCVACDGHGEQGEVVAERVTRMLPLLLDRHISSMSLVDALPQAFLDAQADLEQCFKTAQFYSGATMAVFCIHQDSHEAWFAHAGDSLAVLGDLATGRTHFITKEHKAHNPTEFRRLESCGAQVIKKRYEDGEVVSRVFIPRTGVPGLAMSRSLGAGCLKKFGVVADPEVHDISDHWKKCIAPCVVMATDGLWDTMDPEEALVEFAGRRRRGLQVLPGAEALVRRSQKLWIESEGDYCDDVTVLFMAPSAGLQVQQ